MPIVAVTTWPTPDAIRRTLLRELTETVHTVTGAPRHKITVHITEINPGQWAEAGIPGDDPSFHGADATPNRSPSHRRTTVRSRLVP